MRITTTDPMSLNDVTDLENAPYLVEGQGDQAIKIFFENEQNRQEYLEMEMHGSGDLSGLNHIFDAMADNPNTGSIN
ncbi:MAG: hypothetical protein D6720_10435 [Gammaproteobacteria bacterium]|nr:MAG: hypothetical protein D6720_10435 [Gammaproteobacteria bacterium]